MIKNMTDARRLILIKLHDARGMRTRLPDTPDRAWLKRRGLIRSGPSNPPGSTLIGGHGRAWYLTDAGRDAVAEIFKGKEATPE
jgi:hypothetical protein